MGLLYHFVKYLGRIGLPLFFGKLEINGQENIPKNFPFLIAPNHQNAFLDAILMGVYMKKPVHFLTRSDVFVPPFIGVLEALNMMPIYRIRDGYDKLSKNEEVFAKCEQLLKNGYPVLIFPEGDMDAHNFLRPLTKGTARLAFQTQKNIDQELYILPVGINYFNHYKPRYKCIVNFGQAIKVNDFTDLYKSHQAKGLITLRNRLTESIKSLLLIPDKADYIAKKKALNRRNERYTFMQLKDMIAKNDFRVAAYFPKLRWLSAFLIIFNPLAILTVDFLLSSKINERQFTASIKYTVGLLLSVIWWLVLYIILCTILNFYIASLIVLISILMLFIRSEIKKFTDPV